MGSAHTAQEGDSWPLCVVGLHMGTTPMWMEMFQRFVIDYVEHIKSYHVENYSTGIQGKAMFRVGKRIPDLMGSEII